MKIKLDCTSCIGSENCNKYCDLQLGASMVAFISGVDAVETKIGEFSKDGKSGKVAYICSGHIIENSSTPAYILSDLQTNIDASGKFTQCGGFQPQQIIQSYINTLNVPQDVKDTAMLQFTKFNSLKMLPVPFKPGSECEVTVENGDQSKVSQARIYSIRWQADHQSGKISCLVVCSIEKGIMDNNIKLVKIPITEYGNLLRLPQLERTLKSSEIKRELIKVTDLGMIKPIVVKDGKITLAIDGSHLFKVVDTRVFVIGTWKNGKMTDIQSGIQQIKDSKAYKYIKAGINYIEKHRRFIAPYGVYEENVIEI